jgi:hypothetical protein
LSTADHFSAISHSPPHPDIRCGERLGLACTPGLWLSFISTRSHRREETVTVEGVCERERGGRRGTDLIVDEVLFVGSELLDHEEDSSDQQHDDDKERSDEAKKSRRIVQTLLLLVGLGA